MTSPPYGRLVWLLLLLGVATSARLKTSAHIDSDRREEMDVDDIIALAGESAARHALTHASFVSEPTSGAEAFNKRGAVKYDEEWFENNCKLGDKEKTGEEVPPGQLGEQFARTADGQKEMQTLIEQVNAMSIDGILRHLLSFYVCMRWVPDERFVKAFQFEMEHVSVDSATKATGEPVSEKEIFQMYADFDAVPMKCGKAMHVQATHDIDAFLRAARKETSGLNLAYEYSKKVAKTSLGFLGIKWGSGGYPKKVAEALQDGARQAAEGALQALPFDGLIRPSKQFKWFGGHFDHDTHDSKAKNLFFLCFGPRVTSFPHKRADAPHIIADMNMAGCNGLWDMEDMVQHVERVKRLFSPELCLTDDLRMKLKEVFLSTFMEMNSDFFEFMTGNFARETGLIEAIPKVLRQSGVINTPTKLLESPTSDSTVLRNLEVGSPIAMAGVDAATGYTKVAFPLEGWIADSGAVTRTNETSIDAESYGRVQKKYARSARLLAGAHTKWIVCDAKENSTDELGFEDNFFRNPKAYAKWISVELEKKAPECKLMDPTTGCIKCAVSVKSDPYRCTVRLGLEPKHVLDALDRGQYPMKSSYYIRDLTNSSDEKKVKKKYGSCLIGRSSKMNISRNALQENFASYDPKSDEVYVVSSEGPDQFSVAPRYRLDERLKAYEKVLQAQQKGEKIPKQTDQEILAKVIAMSVYQEQHENSAIKHYNSQFGPLLTFEEHVPQLHNRPSHFVQYVVSCPCDASDFSSLESHQSFASAELTDFYNAGGAH